MSTADRFDRHVESLMDELAGQGLPSYMDEAVATATARPQRRPSWLGRLAGGWLASRSPMLRTALIGLPVVLALTIGLVGTLVIGGPDETPSPMPSLGTVVPDGTPEPTASGPGPTATSPTDTALEPCPGYADAADARTVDDGGVAWQSETGAPPPIESRREGRIAAFARDLPGGRPAVVLIHPATGETCRLIDLNRNDEVFYFQWTLRGDALAISTGRRVLVLSSAGLTELDRVPGGETADVSVAWSPTGEAIAIGGPGSRGLRIVQPDWSTTEVPIENDLEFAWSPDGSRLYMSFASHTGEAIAETLVTVDGQLDPLVLETGAAGWLDDGTLITAHVGAGTGLDAYDIATGSRTTWSTADIVARGLQRQIGFAPGMTGVAMFANDDAGSATMDLRVIDLPSGEVHVLAEGIVADGIIGDGAWSPDDTRLAVSVLVAEGDERADSGVWLYSREGGEPTLLTTLRVQVTLGAWQPAQ